MYNSLDPRVGIAQTRSCMLAERPCRHFCLALGNLEKAMTKTTTNSQVAGRDQGTRPGRRYGLRNKLAGITGRISTKARWMVTAAIGLITPAVLIAENAATP